MSHRISHGHYDANPLFDRHIWACGFRSFFLAAAGYAVLAVVAWAVHWRGWLDIPAAIPPSQWHAYEMIFGMFGAAIAGFLLTAVPSWTGFPARSGRRLALLFGIWVAGRICMWFADFMPLTVTGSVNAAFFAMLACYVVPSLWNDPDRRHRSFIWIVPLLFCLQSVTFLGWSGALDGFAAGDDVALRSLNAGLHVYLAAIVLAVTRISMRLVPLALEEQGDTDSRFMPIPPRRNLALASLILFALADFIAPDNAVTGWIALAAAAAQLDRMTDWHVGRVLLKSYVLILYLAYAWLAAGLAWLGLNALFFDQDGASVRHAFAMGAGGTAIMLVLVVAGLSHTGRDVTVPPVALIAVALVSVATIFRVLGPVAMPDHYAAVAVGGASILWAGAFAIYFAAFAPMLTRPRIDGEPG